MISSLFIASSSSSYRNPCGDGNRAEAAIMEVMLDGVNPKNMTFLVCNPGSYGMDYETKLGLGLGVGIPAFIFVCLIIYRILMNYRDKRLWIKSVSNPVPRSAIHPNTPLLPNLFETMNSRVYRDCMIGNFTDDVKTALNTLTTEDLHSLKHYANEHRKLELVNYIDSIIHTRQTNHQIGLDV